MNLVINRCGFTQLRISGLELELTEAAEDSPAFCTDKTSALKLVQSHNLI